MSGKNKFLATAGFYILVGVLLFYAASRTLHFVQLVMANSTWGYLFLFATGVGAVIWLYVYLSYAQGAQQRGIAFAMGIIDLLGELALVFADTIYVGSQEGLVQMSPNEMNTFIIVSVLIVGINIFAGYMFKLSDLHAQQEQHAQDLVDHVTAETMKHMNTPEARQAMVQELLPIYRSAIAARVQSEIFARASNTGIDAEAIGWPLARRSLPSGPNSTDRKYEQAIPHPIETKAEQPDQPGAPDNYGPLWKNSTSVTPTLDAYAWVCLNCDGHNPPHTFKCSSCGQPRTNGSPVTAFSDLPQKKEAGESRSPFLKSQSE